MRITLTLMLVLLNFTLYSQISISGKIVNNRNQPIANANVFIKGTYDGSITDEFGDFKFSTANTLPHTLVIILSSYDEMEYILVDKSVNLIIPLQAKINELDQVVVTAGTLESGDRARVSVLKALDVVTTAGAAGNIIAALQTLPGTQIVGENGRLFVRGGESDETQTYIDGLRVAQPYSANAKNLPSRGRFSPFLFSGIAFSTGGYSAEYGEALSGVLLLNTKNEIEENETNISIMSVGVGLSQSKKWLKSGLNASVSYTNLAGYNAIVPQRIVWNKPYQSLSGEIAYKQDFSNGALKFYSAFDITQFNLNQLNSAGWRRIGTTNSNFYSNISYSQSLNSGWKLFSGISYGIDDTKVNVDDDENLNNEGGLHDKLKFNKRFSNSLRLTFGADYFSTSFTENINHNTSSEMNLAYKSAIFAGFGEMDISLSTKFDAKIGIRAANNYLINDQYVSPRISVAYKINSPSQISAAFGQFEQSPNQNFLKFHRDFSFKNEEATHYIVNYQYSKENRILRLEAYFKNYNQLLKYNFQSTVFPSNFSNSASGYARGLDVFYRDGKSIKNLEYWISYSFINSKRDYRNYPNKVTPPFVAAHTFSLVGKYWINTLRSQGSITQSFASGRPYNNPNSVNFMDGKTKAFSSLSLGWAYLISQQKILYLSASNVLGTNNIFGYEFDSAPNNDGIFESQPITQPAPRFIFIGFFWTISADKKNNQLNTL